MCCTWFYLSGLAALAQARGAASPTPRSRKVHSVLLRILSPSLLTSADSRSGSDVRHIINIQGSFLGLRLRVSSPTRARRLASAGRTQLLLLAFGHTLRVHLFLGSLGWLTDAHFLELGVHFRRVIFLFFLGLKSLLMHDLGLLHEYLYCIFVHLVILHLHDLVKGDTLSLVLHQHESQELLGFVTDGYLRIEF